MNESEGQKFYTTTETVIHSYRSSKFGAQNAFPAYLGVIFNRWAVDERMLLIISSTNYFEKMFSIQRKSLVSGKFTVFLLKIYVDVQLFCWSSYCILGIRPDCTYFLLTFFALGNIFTQLVSILRIFFDSLWMAFHIFLIIFMVF